MKHFFFVLRYVRYVELALIISNKTSKKLTQLVSSSNKRSSSGEMKIDLKRVGICRGEGLDTFGAQ